MVTTDTGSPSPLLWSCRVTRRRAGRNRAHGDGTPGHGSDRPRGCFAGTAPDRRGCAVAARTLSTSTRERPLLRTPWKACGPLDGVPSCSRPLRPRGRRAFAAGVEERPPLPRSTPATATSSASCSRRPREELTQSDDPWLRLSASSPRHATPRSGAMGKAISGQRAVPLFRRSCPARRAAAVAGIRRRATARPRRRERGVRGAGGDRDAGSTRRAACARRRDQAQGRPQAHCRRSWASRMPRRPRATTACVGRRHARSAGRPIPSRRSAAGRLGVRPARPRPGASRGRLRRLRRP